MKQQLKLAALWTVPVVHCPHAFAVVVEGAAGWKFVFSGDTRPCPQLTQAAKGATMLVHEVRCRHARDVFSGQSAEPAPTPRIRALNHVAKGAHHACA